MHHSFIHCTLSEEPMYASHTTLWYLAMALQSVVSLCPSKPWDCCCSWTALSCLTPEWPVAPECWSVNIWLQASSWGPRSLFVICLIRPVYVQDCLEMRPALHVFIHSWHTVHFPRFRGLLPVVKICIVHLKKQLLFRKYGFWVNS